MPNLCNNRNISKETTLRSLLVTNIILSSSRSQSTFSFCVVSVSNQRLFTQGFRGHSFFLFKKRSSVQSRLLNHLLSVWHYILGHHQNEYQEDPCQLDCHFTDSSGDRSFWHPYSFLKFMDSLSAIHLIWSAIQFPRKQPTTLLSIPSPRSLSRLVLVIKTQGQRLLSFPLDSLRLHGSSFLWLGFPLPTVLLPSSGTARDPRIMRTTRRFRLLIWSVHSSLNAFGLWTATSHGTTLISSRTVLDLTE